MPRPTDSPVAARIFELVWDTLVDVLGTSATATLFRHAIRNVRAKGLSGVDMTGFDVIRDRLEYRFVLPPSWESENEQGVVGLLERQPELQRSGILRATDEAR